MVYHGSYMTLWITPVFSNQQSTGHGKPTVLDLPAGHRPHLPHGGCYAADHQGKAGTNHFEMGTSWGYSLRVYIYGIQSFIIYEYTLYLIYTYIYIYIHIYIHSFEWGDDQDFLAVLCRHGGGLHPIDGHFTLETYDDSPVETESLPFASSKH